MTIRSTVTAFGLLAAVAITPAGASADEKSPASFRLELLRPAVHVEAVEPAGFRAALLHPVATTDAAADTGTELFDKRLLAAGLGALGGILAFNLAYGGTAALPFLAESTAVAGVGGATAIDAASGAVAVSRIYAVSSSVVGALVGDWFYRNQAADRVPSVPRGVAGRVAPQ